MTTTWRLPSRWGPLLLFGLLAALLIAVEHTLVQRVSFTQHPALPAAVAIDLLVVLPGLFYLCVVRHYRLPLSTVAAAFGGGLALSHWLLPATGLPLLAWAGRLAGVFEVATVGYAVVRLRHLLHAYRAARLQSTDFVENLYAAGQPVLGRFSNALLAEVLVVRYGLLGAWAKPEVGPTEIPFSNYRKSGFIALLATLGGLTLLETAAAHLIVGHWHPRLAWLLTAFGAYSLLWLLGHGQAVRRRPVLVSATALVVRVGLGWRVSIEKQAISSLRRMSDTPPPAPNLLNAARLLLTTPNLLLTFAMPQVVLGPYGLQRTVKHLAIYVDEPQAFAQQLQLTPGVTW